MADNMWTVGMEGEDEGKKLWKEGEHEVIIHDVKLIDENESKSGNPYFFWTLLNDNDEKIEVRTTLLKGKRWLLKQMLMACGISSDDKDPAQKYKFNPTMVVGKKVIISVVNRESSFTNSNGRKITITKSEVNRVQAINEKAESDKIPF